MLVGSSFRLDGDERLVLQGQQPVLDGLVGSKVWITGSRLADTIMVSSYGIIRPPSE